MSVGLSTGFDFVCVGHILLSHLASAVSPGVLFARFNNSEVGMRLSVDGQQSIAILFTG